jgi:hypothetical protein
MSLVSNAPTLRVEDPVNRLLSFSILTTALAAASTAAADPNPSFKYASADDRTALEKVDTVKWEAAMQAGLLLTTGNSRLTSFSSALTASRKEKRNKLSLEASAAYGRSSILLGLDANGNGALSSNEIDSLSTTSTKAWLLKGRYDRFLTEHNSLFAAAGISGDKPAGKELVGNAQLGYSRMLYQSGAHSFTGEIGYDYTYEDLVAAGDGLSIHSLRGFAGYKGTLSEDTGVEASVEGLFYVNGLDTPTGHVDVFEDDRVNSKLSLSTKLSTRLAFRFSFEAKYDHAPAPRPALKIPYEAGFVPVAERLDTKTEATLIISLL